MMNQPQSQQQYDEPQYGAPPQPIPQPQYRAHPATAAQPARLSRATSYIMIMIAVIFIPVGLIVITYATNNDHVKIGKTLFLIGDLLAIVFTTLVLGFCPDLDKHEKLGLLIFLAFIIYVSTVLGTVGRLY